MATVQQQQALLDYELIFNQSSDYLNKNQDFKICVTAKLDFIENVKQIGK